MAAKILAKEKLKGLLGELASRGSLVAPVREEGVALFRPVRDAEGIILDYVKTALSAKEVFLPQTEPMMYFSTAGGSLELREAVPVEERVLFGARPCDLAALELLDKVFLAGDFVDSYYQVRREKTTTIGLACPNPGRTCFCTSFGLSPGSTRGADVMFYQDGDGYLVEALTPKGDKLLGSLEKHLSPADDERAEKVRQGYRSKPTPLGSRVDVEGVARALDGMFEHPYWARLSPRCLSCGICTYSCPTCYCFCVVDLAVGDRGVRSRCWDACMYPQFLLMAGGHNPRPTKKERVRQRFMHKLNYYVHREGEYLCTGCGRCVEKCPVGLHIAGVIMDVKGMERDAEQSAS